MAETGTATDSNRRKRRRWAGIGQLTLVEHALCTLDSTASLSQSAFQPTYYYWDEHRNKKRVTPYISTPLGLTAHDEFLLWGLLSLVFSQEEPSPKFQATPHYCLKHLGIISTKSKGGRQYRDFRQALRRIAAVCYSNDRFYDPVQKEHRAVDFQFLAVDSPRDACSDRAITFFVNQKLFELCAADAGHFKFDLDIYRRLDPASRRLFMLLRKVFHRHDQITFDIEHLAVNVLGYGKSRESKKLAASIRRCATRLLEIEMIKLPAGTANVVDLIKPSGRTRQCITFHRGQYLAKEVVLTGRQRLEDSPLYDQLQSIGFSGRAMARLIAKHSHTELTAVVRRYTASDGA